MFDEPLVRLPLDRELIQTFDCAVLERLQRGPEIRRLFYGAPHAIAVLRAASDGCTTFADLSNDASCRSGRRPILDVLFLFAGFGCWPFVLGQVRTE